MKYIISILLAVFISLPQNQLLSQNISDTTIQLKVDGNCALCKKRIETAAKGRGVSSAVWNMKTKILSLTYDPQKTTASKVNERIVGVGHDTELAKADDEVYKNLHECCLYRAGNTGEADAHSLPDNDTSILANAVALPAKGEVYAHGNGGHKPLSGASVMWEGTTSGTITNAEGKFDLGVNTQSRRLVVSFAGYHTDTVDVLSAEPMHIMLQPASQLKSVTVRGARSAYSVNTASAIRAYNITPKELEKAACCNLSESFETNPSVDVTFNDAITGSKQIQMLGLSGNYTQLTVENLPGPRGLATAQGLNAIPGTWIEGIQLIKGTGSVVNGFESIAGQINVELKKPDNSEQLYANVYRNDQGKTDINLNLSKKVSDRWSTALLLHDAFAYQKVDMNMDHFRDFPTGNLFSGINRWSYTDGKGTFGQFGVKYLTDNKIGGSITFDPAKDRLSNHHYGVEINTDRKEVFGKIGYVYPGRPYKSIGLQVSAYQHKQDSYFGTTTYMADQQNVYANLIYQSIIGHTGHKFKTGASFAYDKYSEDLNQTNFARREIVPGAFFEYIFKPQDNFELIAGIRADYNNLYGWFASPRLNVRYEPFAGTTVRASIGRGQRTANIFAENNSVFVSSRQVSIVPVVSGGAYGLAPEVSWNKGISIDQRFRLFNRNSMLSFDFFRNDFVNQVVVDIEDPRQVKFYNLDGRSYSNSVQAELNVEPLRKLNVRLAYRYFDVKTTYSGKLLQKPLVSPHRAFVNLGYELGTWKFDYTVSYNGERRLPSTASNPGEYQLGETTPSFFVMNAQVTKSLGKKHPLDIYVGGENLGNFIQPDAIVAPGQPFGQHFDASMIWGPISGRMIYAGIRFKIK